MDGKTGSPGDLTVRSNNSRTPLIQVTLPNVPDEQDGSPYSEPREEGVDNPAFHRGSVDITPTLTPQPNQSRSSSIFVFDPECSSLYSRRGSSAVYSRRGSYTLDTSNPRTPMPIIPRSGSQGQNPSEKSSLTVPTITTSKNFLVSKPVTHALSQVY